MMANDVLSTEMEKLKENLRQTRKAILGRGGTIGATAGLDAVPKAVFDIPATSSIAFYTDDTPAYRKDILSGAEDYAQLISLGGGLTVKSPEEELVYSAVNSINLEKKETIQVNYLPTEIAGPEGWGYNGETIYVFVSGTYKFTIVGHESTPNMAKITCYDTNEYGEEVSTGEYSMGEEFYVGIYATIEIFGIETGTVIEPMLCPASLPEEYTKTYYPYGEGVSVATVVSSVDIPDALKSVPLWGAGIIAGGEYYVNTYNFTTKKFTKYITETLEISEKTLNGTDVTLGTYTASGNYIAVNMKYATSLWSTKGDAIICTRFNTIANSKEATPMSVYISNYRNSLRFYMPSGITSKADCEAWFKANPVYLQCVNQKATEETLNIDAPTPFFIKTAGGNAIAFENEAQADVPSSIKYVRKV